MNFILRNMTTSVYFFKEGEDIALATFENVSNTNFEVGQKIILTVEVKGTSWDCKSVPESEYEIINIEHDLRKYYPENGSIGSISQHHTIFITIKDI